MGALAFQLSVPGSLILLPPRPGSHCFSFMGRRRLADDTMSSQLLTGTGILFAISSGPGLGPGPGSGQS